MIKRLIPSILVLFGLLGCESTGVPPVMHADYQEYLSMEHYRAFAATPRPGREAAASAWSWRNGTVEGAIEQALENCQKGRKKYLTSRIYECRLHSIGDIRVAGMSDDELEAAIKIYKADVASGQASGSTSASDSVICNFAITTKDGTVSWESRADWIGYVNEAKRRNLTPEQCAELLGR